MYKRFLLILLFIISFFTSFLYPNRILAAPILQDDFHDGSITDGAPVNWEIFTGPQGYWTVINEELEGSVYKPCNNDDIFSYLVGGEYSWDNYSLSTKVKGIIGIDKKIMVRYQSTNTRYDINLISNQAANIQKWKNGSSDILAWGSYGITNNIWYTVKVEVFQENLKLFIDGQKIIDIDDTIDPLFSGKVGLQIWPGFYAGCNRYTTTRFDDVVVTSIASPTPTPTPLPPVVILPGLGTSWSHQAMGFKTEVPQSQWHKLIFVNFYNPLIQTLKNAGYEDSGPNKNLFFFNYDWRKPIENIAEDLKIYLADKVHPPPGEQTNLIGHSLGGMVARTYLQNNPDHQIDKVITLGSPHQGSPTVYYAWEGGDISQALGQTPEARLAAELYLRLWYLDPLKIKKETIPTMMPGLKDLLPSFDYLKKDNNPVPLGSMIEKNDWLINLNLSTPDHLTNHLYPFAGLIPDSVTEWIHVAEPTWLDKILKRYPDGHPVGDSKNLGDKYVLAKSAFIGETEIVEFNNLDHEEIVTDPSVHQKILDILGFSLQSTQSTTITPASINNALLLVYLVGEAQIKGFYDSQNQPAGEISDHMVVFSNPYSDLFYMDIQGAVEENIRLLVGQIMPDKETSWTEITSTIDQNEHKYFHFMLPRKIPLMDWDGSVHLESALNQYDQLKSNLKPVQRKKIQEALDKNDYHQAIIYLYQARFVVNDFVLKDKIQQVIDDLEYAYFQSQYINGYTYPQDKLNREITNAKRQFELTETLLKLKSRQKEVNPNLGLLYLFIEEKLNAGLQRSSFETHIKVLGVQELCQEVIHLLI